MATEPVNLSDEQLDDVTGGSGGFAGPNDINRYNKAAFSDLETAVTELIDTNDNHGRSNDEKVIINTGNGTNWLTDDYLNLAVKDTALCKKISDASCNGSITLGELKDIRDQLWQYKKDHPDAVS